MRDLIEVGYLIANVVGGVIKIDKGIKDLFIWYGIFGCATPRANLEEIFATLPLEHPLRKQFNDMLIDYKIIGENNGS